MNEKKQNIIVTILTVTLIIETCAWLGMRLYNVHLQNRNNNATAVLSTAQKKYNQKLNKKVNNYIATHLPTNNPQIDGIVEQKRECDLLTKESNIFFKTYFTYNSQKEYLERKQKLMPMITQDIANSNKIFDDGLDTTGHSIIEAAKIKSEFDDLSVKIQKIDGNNIQAIVNVKYEASNSISEGFNQGMRIYQVTYDKSIQKFTEIKLLQVSGQNTNLSNYNN